MNTKRLIPMMLISFAVIFGWQLFVHQYLYPRHPEWRKPGQPAATQPAATTQVTVPPVTPTTSTALATPTTAANAPSISAAPTTSSAPTPPGVRVVASATQPSVATLGDDAAFAMIVKISSAGAGLNSVTLKDFDAPPDVVNRRQRSKERKAYVFQEPVNPNDPYTRPMSTRSVTVNGTEVQLAGVDWILEKQDGRSATFMVDLGPVRVRKIYELHERSAADRGLELSVRHEFEAKTDGGTATATPAKVKFALSGPVTPPREHERGPDLQMIAGYDDGYQRAIISHHLVEEYDPKKPSGDITKGDDNVPFLWAGTASVYFTALYRPEPLDPAKASPDYIARVTAFTYNPQDETYLRRGGVTFESSELTVAPGATLALPSNLFLGPRWREILKLPHYANFPRDYDQSLIMRAGPCGYCTFDWLINGLVWLLRVFHTMTRDWGLAIICLVILVRGLLHPITKRSQVSMLRMGKLGPEIERLKQRHGDDKDALNKDMMQLYKDQGIGMYLGCLPMFLQMPIWIALWSALNTTFELRQAPFLWGFTWIKDLARPDALIEFSSTIQLPFGLYLSSLNLLPILLAFVFFLQQHYTPKPPATTPEQETQQKMMKWMSLLFPIFLYPTPSGLCLYIFTSTSIGIIESKRIRDHIKQKEAAEKEGKIIVDAGIKKKRDDDEKGGSAAKKPKGPKGPKRTGLGGWIDQLKAKAEEIQRDADKRGKK
ncbi:MAG: YidC/Oxa1 family rane protein insertase [Humisphaera sp.]|nr:YidC/Oxa1 family rane protein insertase [Humisphaera sp.]